MRARASAAALSLLLPGIGQLYVGARRRGAAILVMSLSVWAAALFESWWSGTGAFAPSASLGFLYLLVLGPAVTDVWLNAAGDGVDTLVRSSRFYVLTMLGSLGPAALPLLWQSPRFGRTAKIIWTLLVVVFVAGALWLFVTVGPAVEELLHEMQGLQLS